MARDALDRLRDELYVLACAVEDVERDLAESRGRPRIAELQEALAWLLEAARPLSAVDRSELIDAHRP